jgi:surfactin synthase thioesterase subunit
MSGVEAVVAFPGAGGSAGMFDEFRAGLRPIALIVPDTPGRGRRTRSSARTVQEAAAELAAELDSRLTGRRYAVFAACVGTLIAFELLREQRRRHLRAPERLLVCGRGGPHLGGGLDEYVDWSDDQLDEYLAGSLPPGYDTQRLPPPLRRLIRSRLRTDIELAAAYRYDEDDPLDVPVYGYRGNAGDPTTEEDLRSWHPHTSSDFRTGTAPGGAYFYLENPASVRTGIVGESPA